MDISSISNSIGSIGLTKQNNEMQADVQGKSFQGMLKDAINEVNTTQKEGYQAMEGIATGRVTNLQDAVQRIEEAELSLKLALEVKNKAIAAFKEIGRIQA